MYNFRLMNQGEFTWSFVYFHGDAEDIANAHQTPDVNEVGDRWCAPDLVGCDRKLNDQLLSERVNGCASVLARKYHVETGIHQCKVYGVDATLFIWENTGYEPLIMSGLICLNTDAKSLDYAQRKFDERVMSL